MHVSTKILTEKKIDHKRLSKTVSQKIVSKILILNLLLIYLLIFSNGGINQQINLAMVSIRINISILKSFFFFNSLTFEKFRI